ncbi:MAG: PliI family lysozyme inhibitor of I-type lysozyme [Akkermansiaceae bacterium]|nr:PliI family lysozyme inhibitor of I-type lysozyme [Akkermansiaceae bacterium]MCF7734046.1 PliI family lysozyme inhibitor of I-type lysozyme [Akkermansiaceae bacterium]
MKIPATPLLSLITLAACTLVSMAEEAAPAKGFDKKLSLQGLTFHVKCPNEGSLNKLTITPTGLEGENKPIVVEVDGSVTGAEVEDLDANGFPEIYVYVTSAGSGSYGSLVAYAANKKRSLTEIFLPDLGEDKVNSKGYMGHDQFAVGEGSLLRRFPIYKAGDSNAKPSGKTRQLQYKLKAGEAGWLLKIDKTTEY